MQKQENRDQGIHDHHPTPAPSLDVFHVLGTSPALPSALSP